MRRIALLVLTLGLLLAACTTDDGDAAGDGTGGSTPSGTATAATPATSDEPTWLFVLDAASATAAPASDDTSELTLEGVSERVVAFTDRPVRSMTTETPAEFVDRWDERGFTDDPPNAALAVGEEIVVVTISEPATGADGALTLTATLVPDEGAAASGRTATTDALPAEMGFVTLFVDASAAAGSLPSFTDVRISYTGAGSPFVLLEGSLASPGRSWQVSVEGTAAVTAEEADSVAINIESDGTGEDNLTVVLVPVQLGPDGTLEGSADPLAEGDVLTAQLITESGPGPVVTAGSDGTFLLGPAG